MGFDESSNFVHDSPPSLNILSPWKDGTLVEVDGDTGVVRHVE